MYYVWNAPRSLSLTDKDCTTILSRLSRVVFQKSPSKIVDVPLNSQQDLIHDFCKPLRLKQSLRFTLAVPRAIEVKMRPTLNIEYL